jgi:hypothetical protein
MSGSPSSSSVLAPGSSQQPLQQRPRIANGSANVTTGSFGSPSSAAPVQSILSQQSQPGPGAHSQPSQPPRQTSPWSARRLNLPPPVILPKPGVVPPTSPSPSPFPRYGHALPATGTNNGELYLFGGLVRESARNDLFQFSTRDLSATLLQTAGEIPSPRVGHASALVSNVLIVWGGDTKTDPKSKPTDMQDDGLYLLNLGKLRAS